MTSKTKTERILEAIDQLRHRKARPDAQRICNYLFRKYSINSAEAKADLQWCCDNGTVLRVEYKGNTSYRNAAKKFLAVKRDHLLKTSASGNKANRRFTQYLTRVFGELVVVEPDYLDSGIPGEEIVRNILSKDNLYTRRYINILLEKEVECGELIRLENGNYLMGPGSNIIINKPGPSHPQPWADVKIKKKLSPSPELPDSPEANEIEISNVNIKDEKIEIREERKIIREIKISLREAKAALLENGTRVGGRRKRAKKVFDPSDNHIPKKRGRPAGSLNKTTIERQQAIRSRSSDESRPASRTSNGGNQFGVCSVCHLQNKRGPNDKMVACRECSNKAHFSCLNGDDMMLKLGPDNSWQCPHCKTCVVCFETSNAGNLTICSVCADAYHATCHSPAIPEKFRSSTKWVCQNCHMPEELEINKIQSNMTFHRKTSSVHDDFSSESLSEVPDYTPVVSRQSSPSLRQHSPVPLPNGHISPNGSESPSNRDSDEDPNIDPSIPDATHWTPDEVYQYFARFFPDEAKVFKEQEIDGRSLLLLKRMDVLTNLKLKLGPADRKSVV